MRKVLLAGIACVVLSACSQGERADVGSAAWTMYQGASDRNAVISRPGFAVRWKFDSGAKINGGLALAGQTLFVDTFKNDLIALDVRTGAEIWHAHARNVLMSTPVLANGLVYVGSGRDGFLIAKATHQPVMSARAGHIWGEQKGDDFLAIDAATGAARWSYRTVGQNMPSPVLEAGAVIFANGDGHAYALNAGSGKVLWTQLLRGISTMASANAGGGRVFISTCHYRSEPTPCETDAFDPRTGTLLWTSPYGNADAAPAYAAGRVFVSGLIRHRTYLGGRGVVASLDARTGRPIWIYRTPTIGVLTAVGSGEVAVAGTYGGGTYYQAIPTQDEFIAFDARTGRIRWVHRSMAPIKMSAIVKDGKVYVGDTAGILYVLDAASGSTLNMTLSREPFSTSPPVLVGETLLFVNGQSVYAVPLSQLPVKGGL